MIRCVLPLEIPLIERSDCRTPLYPHQATMMDTWPTEPAVVLAAKTGSGKTAAAVLPVLLRGEYAILVYPTNELMRDQVKSVQSIAAAEGIRAEVYSPQIPFPVHADCLLIPLDAAALDCWQKGPTRSRVEALRSLLIRDRPRIVFTNPDILFNILSAQYHLDALAPLDIYRTLVFDEFHLYAGAELAHAIMIVHLARGLGFFQKVVLLSATPHPEVKKLLDRALRPKYIPGSDHTNAAPTRTAVHEVTVTALLAREESIDQIASEITNSLPELIRLRQENPQDTYIPAVAVVNSVLDAIRLEDEIVARGFDRKSIAPIRGLSNRAIRQRAGKLIAIGTSAIEVGVDFDCDLLLFEALEAASFLQRFGRVGRHRRGRALVFLPPNAFQAMSAAPDSMDRTGFEGLIHLCYPLSDAQPWFAATQYGLLTAASIPERLFRVVKEDRHASSPNLLRFKSRLDTIFDQYAASLESADSAPVRAKLSAFNRNPELRSICWYGTYLRLNRFRTSMPSVEVHDWREEGRRGEWDLGTYDIDLATLLKRGRNIRYHPKTGLTITGIGTSRRVRAGENVDHLSPGVPLRTSDHPIRLLQDGLDTPVSNYLSDTDHVFAIAPRGEVERLIDWRLSCFDAGRYLLAFDGAALLLIEAWKRARRA